MKKISPGIELATLAIGIATLVANIVFPNIPLQWRGIAIILIAFGLVGGAYGLIALFFNINTGPVKFSLAIICLSIGVCFVIAEPEGIPPPLLVPLGGGVLLTLVLQSIRANISRRREDKKDLLPRG